MNERQKRIAQKLGLAEDQFEKKSTPAIIEISREDFELLDVEQDATYHIIEDDGTITIRKGENK